MLNILVLIILLIIILILFLGVKIKFSYVKNDDYTEGCLKIYILKKIRVYTLKLPSDEKSEESETEVNYKKLYELAKPYFKRLLKAVSIKRIRNHLVIGFANFAKTGEYIGYIWSIIAILNTTLPNTQLSAEPSFKGEVLNLKGNIEIEIYPIKIIPLLLEKDFRNLIRGVLN